MSSETKENAPSRLDQQLADLRRYAQHRPKKLPANVVVFPIKSIIDRAIMPMHFQFLNLAQIRNGLPTKTMTVAGMEYAWVATKRDRAVLQQRYPDLSIHALGEPTLLVDNTAPKQKRRRHRLPKRYR